MVVRFGESAAESPSFRRKRRPGASTALGYLSLLSVRARIGVLTLVLLGGVSLTAIGFHAVRLRAAAGDRPDEIAPELVRRHLAITEQLAHAGSARPQRF